MLDSLAALLSHDPIRAVQALLTQPRYFWLLASLVVIGDATLTQFIIHLVPCQTLDFQFSGQRPHHAT